MLRLACNLSGAEELEALLWGLAKVAELQVRRYRLPALYLSGVRYVAELKGREQWQSAVETYLTRVGDCEDLVAYRVGELWAAGRDARPHVRLVSSRGFRLYHCRVWTPSGLEDPSKVLGMKGKG